MLRLYGEYTAKCPVRSRTRLIYNVESAQKVWILHWFYGMLALEKIMQKELIHMKKSILILILTAMLTACVPIENPQESSEISTAQAVTEASKYDEDSELESHAETATQPSTECEISTAETIVTTMKTKSETVCTTTSVTDAQKEKGQYDSTET